MAASKYIQANRDVVDRFSRATNTSLDYAQTHPDEVRKVIPTFTKTPAAAAAKLRLPAFDSKLDRKGIELEAQLTAKYGIIDKAPTYEGHGALRVQLIGRSDDLARSRTHPGGRLRRR